MSFTYVLSTDIGKVRLNIQDTESASAAFSDEEINAILTQVGSDVNRASARLLLILAGNKAKLARRITAGDYSEDLTQVAKELRAQAEVFLEMAGMEAADATAELQATDFAYRDFINNEALRENP